MSRAITIHITPATAATLCRAARGEPAEMSLSEFCGRALGELAQHIESYWTRFDAIMESPGNLPDDLPGTLRRLSELWDLGSDLTLYCAPQWLRLDEVYDRIRQLTIIATAIQSGEIEVPVMVEWEREETAS